MNKRGQLTMIIIVALVIVAMIATYFLVRGAIFQGGISSEFQPIYDSYSSCIEDKAKTALQIAGTQGGYVYSQPFLPGSEYAPSSSQLNFLGFGVPYWFYITGNGLIKEQMPSQIQIEQEIARYVEENIRDCNNFEQFYARGYMIEFAEPEVIVSIKETQVDINVNARVSASLGESSATKSNHDVAITSKFGKFYNLAKQIYNKEKSEAFLEKYAVDVLNLYAPVDGVDISCAPKIWQTREVADTIKDGLVANIGTIKLDGDYYSLANKKQEYFVVNQKVDESINMIYSKDWPTKIEIAGDNGDLMIAEPVGNSEGLGIMGFCYSPYHFVYDVTFPVMIQIYNSEEIFQFPVIAIVDKNLPREGMAVKAEIEETTDICQFNTQDINVKVYDSTLNPLNANLSYICFTQECSIGQTKNGELREKVPSCLNGYILARANGFTEKKQLFSSNSETLAEIFLDREYEVELALSVGGKFLKDNAVITFEGAKSTSAVLPGSSKVKLSEGLYNITVYVYGNSSITIPATTKRQCVSVAKGGLAGLFGGTEEKCFDISVPSTKIEYALLGGGASEVYLLPEDLEKGRLELSVDSLPVPKTLEELANNYELFSMKGVTI
ncbi:MAG: hypothetical protein Q8L29_00555 [archaeon]|nr:hypothetical protein [archaeon]